jgi:hypothetical protein
LTINNLNDTHSSFIKIEHNHHATPTTEMTTIKNYKTTGYKAIDLIKIQDDMRKSYEKDPSLGIFYDINTYDPYK